MAYRPVVILASASCQHKDYVGGSRFKTAVTAPELSEKTARILFRYETGMDKDNLRPSCLQMIEGYGNITTNSRGSRHELIKLNRARRFLVGSFNSELSVRL